MENPNDIMKDELREIAPELSKLERKNPFAVPSDYFDDFSMKLQNRMASEKKVKQPWYTIIYKPQFSIATLVSIILIATGTFYYNHSQKQLTNDDNIYWDEVISENNTVNYLFDENSLEETLADLTPDTEADQINNTENTLNNVSTEDINDYLKNNNSDIFYEN